MFKNNEFTLAASLAILAIAASCCAREVTPEKMKKALPKIEQLLEKRVLHKDMQSNVAVLRELRDTKSSSLMSKLGAGSCVIEPLNLLIQFTASPSNRYECGSDLQLELAATIDSGLPDDIKESPNYPLSRVELMIEHYAYEEVQRCGERAPYMKHAHKQLAYDAINTRLVSELPEVEEVEANLDKVYDIQQMLPNQFGALARAMLQFLELRRLLDAMSCDDWRKSLEVMRKNELGTRKNIEFVAHPVRRVDRVFYQALVKHERLCRPIYFRQIGGYPQIMEPKIYLTLLRLITDHFLLGYPNDEVKAQLSEKKVDADFAIPLLKEHFAKNLLSSKDLFDLTQYKTASSEQLYRVLDDATAGQSDNKYLHMDTRGDDKDVKAIFNREIIRRCETFQDLVKEPIEVAEFFIGTNPGQVLTSYQEHPDEAQNYHMVRAGYWLCKDITDNQSRLFFEILAKTSSAAAGQFH